MSAILRQIFQMAQHTLHVNNIVIAKTCFPILSTLIDALPTHQVTSLRYRRPRWAYSRVFRQIRGGGRPVPEGKPIPMPRIYGWRPVLPADGKYTTKPLPIIKMGGRDPVTGHAVVKTIGGGHKKKYRWVIYKREAPQDGSVLEEKVFQVRYDPCRSAQIALVASADQKRWILATENMKVGDIIRTNSEIPRIPVLPSEGDAHPVGALPLGTLIHLIEPTPGFGGGGIFCRAAGVSAQYLRKIDNKCLIQLPSKEQILIDERCMVVVGRVSFNMRKFPIGSPNRTRWLGKRMRSGLFHRKDGYCGRKIHPPKSIKDLFLDRPQAPEIYQLEWDNE